MWRPGGRRGSCSGSVSVAPVQTEASAVRRAVAAISVDARAPAVAAAQATVAPAIATAVAAAQAIATAQAAIATAPIGTAHAVVAVAQASVVVAVAAHGLGREGFDGGAGVGVLSLSITLDHGPFIRACVVGGTQCRAFYDMFPTNLCACTSESLLY